MQNKLVESNLSIKLNFTLNANEPAISKHFYQRAHYL